MNVTQSETIKAIDRLEQPAGMYLPSWRRLKRVLRVIAKHLPDPYPSMRRLASKTGIPSQSVSRLLIQAEQAGLITRTVTEHRGSYTYAFLFGPTSDESGPEEELRSSSLPTVVKKTSGRRMARPAASPSKRRVNKWAGSCCVCGFPVQPGDGFLHGRFPVHQPCDSGETDREQLKEYLMKQRDYQRQVAEDIDGPAAFGEDPNPAPVTTTVKTTPAVRAARHFESRWITDATAKFPHWRGEYRCLHQGAAIGYIHSQFLAKGYTVEHVEAYIDAFYDDLLDVDSALQPKEGQTAWQLFTGWWGSVPVADPAIERARWAEHERVQQQYAVQSERNDAIRAAAWERVSAAMDAGLDPEPEDLKAAGLPQIRRRVS